MPDAEALAGAEASVEVCHFWEIVALISTIFCIVRYLLTTRLDSYARY